MKKNKHDHKGTKALKLTLFFTLMLAPLLAIAFKCGYAMFNKNAYESYSKIEIQESINITEISQYTEGQQYQFNYKGQITNGTSPVTFTYISLTASDLQATDAEYNTLTKWWLNTNQRIYFSNDNQTTIKYYSLTNTTEFKFVGNITAEYLNVFYINRTITTTQALDKAFYYAVDEMQNSDLFNWTTNTLMYSPIQAMTSGMGITTPSIAILVCYWLYLTAIYIVIDIVVETFTCITHMITNKLAE